MRTIHLLSFFIAIFNISCSEELQDNEQYVNQFNENKAKKAFDDSVLIASLPQKDTNLLSHDNVISKLEQFGSKNPETQIQIDTKFGVIKIQLYDDTPLHRANFIMLTKRAYFDSTLFYRVVNDFMIQGGNSDRDDITEKMSAIGHYTIPEEIKAHHIHKRGSLAMAVSEQLDIPENERNMNSSPFNFYIVQNGPMNEKYLQALEKKYDLNLSEMDRNIYKSVGGAPHLDGKYTVFGEVYSGFDVIDKIASLPTDKDERPLKDVTLSVKILK